MKASYLNFTASVLAARLNRLIAAGTPAHIITTAIEETIKVMPGNEKSARMTMDMARRAAAPISPIDAQARKKKEAWKASLAKKPGRVNIGMTNAEERYWLMKQLAEKGEHGLIMSAEHRVPFKPLGERLVREGLATVRRELMNSFMSQKHSRRTVVYLTPEGLKAFEDMQAKRDKKERKRAA